MMNLTKLFFVAVTMYVVSQPLSSSVSPLPERLCPGEIISFNMTCGAEQYPVLTVTQGGCSQHLNCNKGNGCYQEQSGSDCPTLQIGHSRTLIETVSTELDNAKRTNQYSPFVSYHYSCRTYTCNSHSGLLGCGCSCQTVASQDRTSHSGLTRYQYSLGVHDKTASSLLTVSLSAGNSATQLHNIRCCSGSRTTADGSCGSNTVSTHFPDQTVNSAQPGSVTNLQITCPANARSPRLSWIPQSLGATALNVSIPGQSRYWLPAGTGDDLSILFPSEPGSITVTPFFISPTTGVCEGTRSSVSVNPQVSAVTGLTFNMLDCKNAAVSWHTVNDELPVKYTVSLRDSVSDVEITRQQVEDSPVMFNLPDYGYSGARQLYVMVTTTAICGQYHNESAPVASQNITAHLYDSDSVSLSRMCGEYDSSIGNPVIFYQAGSPEDAALVTIRINSTSNSTLIQGQEGVFTLAIDIPENETDVYFSYQPVFSGADPAHECLGEERQISETITVPVLRTGIVNTEDGRIFLDLIISGAQECSYCISSSQINAAPGDCQAGEMLTFDCSKPYRTELTELSAEQVESVKVFTRDDCGHCWTFRQDMFDIIVSEEPVTTSAEPTSEISLARTASVGSGAMNTFVPASLIIFTSVLNAMTQNY